ncbi:1122_t:CDS:2 [Scutellospora calospora]|uniref:1122_t:CDS:1 n=1 Tax=Scutellospora calospora TaxID=85575 RepID=A0ACA9JTV4_9GLOM|nr:1122_t:CDS:2 [Scutellospora calospora]
MLQKRLLSLITPVLAVFNDQSDQSLSKIETKKLPSKFVVRTAIKLGKSKLNREMPYIVTPEKASKMGENLGKEILSSYPKIKKKIDQLENPNSYEDYFNSLPNTICNFFQALIMVLQQQKQKVVNKKRHQHVSTYTYARLESIKKQTSKPGNIVQESTIQQNTLAPLSETNRSKQIRRTTTKAEKAILAQLIDYEENLPETAVTKVFWELQHVSLDWTTERIKLYWRNNRRRMLQE